MTQLEASLAPPDADTSIRSTAQLARVASAGALTGIVGMTIAIVTLGAASTDGTDADPVVSRAVTTGSAGAFLVAAMGFAALLMAAGMLTLRSGALARWTGIVALIGAASFLITSLTVLDGTSDGSVFGYRFFSWRRRLRHVDDGDEHRQIPRTSHPTGVAAPA